MSNTTLKPSVAFARPRTVAPAITAAFAAAGAIRTAAMATRVDAALVVDVQGRRLAWSPPV